jgi:hypothetical protein
MADYVAKGKPAKVGIRNSLNIRASINDTVMQYEQGFMVGDQVWVKIPKSPKIVAWVKETYYDEDNDEWVYVVQEKDSTGNWYGKNGQREHNIRIERENQSKCLQPLHLSQRPICSQKMPQAPGRSKKMDFTGEYSCFFCRGIQIATTWV